VRLKKEVLRKIRHIEIHTKRLLKGTLIGDSRSALKGTGFEFDQIREYQVGDDVRSIDWNASARMNSLLMKQYTEERSRTILLVVDVSHSSSFGVVSCKRDTIAQVASVLALVGDFGKDLVGLLLVSTEVEEYVPPGRGAFHVRKIMELLFSYQAKQRKTNISAAFAHLLRLKKKDAIVFVVSDFIDSNVATYLPQMTIAYDMVAIRCLDEYEKQLPSVGFIMTEDIETGQIVMLDMRKAKVARPSLFLKNRLIQQDVLFKKYGINLLNISQQHDFVGEIIRFFRKKNALLN